MVLGRLQARIGIGVRWLAGRGGSGSSIGIALACCSGRCGCRFARYCRVTGSRRHGGWLDSRRFSSGSSSSSSSSGSWLVCGCGGGGDSSSSNRSGNVDRRECHQATEVVLPA